MQERMSQCARADSLTRKGERYESRLGSNRAYGIRTREKALCEIRTGITLSR